jgi:hypothetical protein
MRFRITQDLRVSKKICQKPTPEGWPPPICMAISPGQMMKIDKELD